MIILGYEIGSQCHSRTLFRSRVLDWVKNKVYVHDYFRHLTGSIRVNVSTQICHLLEYSETILLVSLLQNLSHILSRNASQLEPSQCGRGFESARLLTWSCPLQWSPQKQGYAMIIGFYTYGCRIDHFDVIICTSYHCMLIKTMCDDKSRYDHILLTDSSRTYFGFEWEGWFFSNNTILFGWKLSEFVHHPTGLLVRHFIRFISIACSLYIDDCHAAQIRLPSSSKLALSLTRGDEFNLACAKTACFVVCYTLVRLGYCMGLSKSILEPKKVVPYLGFKCDSDGAFRHLPKKREKFACWSLC